LVPGVDDGAGDAAIGEGVVERGFVDNAAAADVDDDGIGAHGVEGGGVDEAGGLGRERQRGDDELRGGEEIAAIVEAPRAVDDAAGRDRAAVGYVDAHFEGVGAGGDRLA